MAQELDVIKVWEDLHKTPELGFEEHETAKYIAEKLTALGYEVETGVGGTGVVGVIKGEEEGPCLMLRADMDALPFTINGEKKVIHACGHDSHSAMLLAAASRLVGKIKRGKLKVLFQQGEETLFGAMSVIKAGVLEDVDKTVLTVKWSVLCATRLPHNLRPRSRAAPLTAPVRTWASTAQKCSLLSFKTSPC